MNKIFSVVLLVGGGAAIAFLVWSTAPTQLPDRGEVQFRKESNYSESEVRDCLFTGKGAELFGRLQYVPVRFGSNSPTAVYVDDRGTDLTLKISGDHTLVSLKSNAPLTAKEVDMLDWCVDNPNLTWIPPPVR